MNGKLYERLISQENVFLAIKMVRSYIEEEKLLSAKDYKVLISLDDIWNTKLIGKIVRDVKNKIIEVINTDKPFECTAYFKPKKYENSTPVFRPIHTANLISQIAMIAMLQVLMFDLNENDQLMLSELSRLIPSNFYGSRISTDADHLFRPWTEQYSTYTSKANELLNRYIDTKEYTYEVTLDLMQFFPSIDPHVAYPYIISLLPHSLLKEDEELVKKIVWQLLRIKLSPLNEIENKWYQSIPGDPYVKGLPQGLPHTYYFSNLIMCKIHLIYQKHMPGEMLFYVDDSVIYTNKPHSNHLSVSDEDKQWLEHTIDEINKDIAKFEQEKRNESNPDEMFINNDFNTQTYKIQVHKPSPEGKSNLYSMKQALKNSGERYLHGLCRETSKFGFDLFAAATDDDITTLLNKTDGIIIAIEEEIERLLNDETATENNNDSQDIYLVRLYRYRKFFKYRSILLRTKKLQDNVDGKLNLVAWLETMNLNDLAILVNGANNQAKKNKRIRSQLILWNGKMAKEEEAYFEVFDKGILGTVISFLYSNYNGSEEKFQLYNELDMFVKRIEMLLYKGKTSHSYLSKAIQHDRACSSTVKIQGHKLRNHIEMYYSALSKKNQQIRDEQFEYNVIACFQNKTSIESLIQKLGLSEVWQWSSIVRASNDSIERDVLFSIFSFIFGFVTEGSYSYAKMDGSPIRYCEIRTFAHLRSKQFKLKPFISAISLYFEHEFRVPIDYSLLQVMDDFERYIVVPSKVDDLIRVHKYCADTWKNGSKHLHFYTLHNQEHAVTLIQQAVSLIRKIDYFQIKQIDYYILFCACYLHDIAMVTLPDYSQFYAKEQERPNLIYTEFVKIFKDDERMDSADVKRQLLESYKKIDEYFEDEIRASHAKNSASEIRTFSELDFLEPSIRDSIARVSKAHRDDIAEVYHAKSHGLEDNINEKQIKILLRIADVLDISRYRISQVILDHNLKNMNQISRFHWISHLLTDKHSIISEYLVSEGESGESCLYDKRIKERIILNVDVLMKQTTNISKTICEDVCSSDMTKENDQVHIRLVCEQNSKCNQQECNFLCKWFSKKNNYLFSELAALKNYLNALPDNFFGSDVNIVVHTVGDANLSGEHFDYLKKHLDSI